MYLGVSMGDKMPHPHRKVMLCICPVVVKWVSKGMS